MAAVVPQEPSHAEVFSVYSDKLINRYKTIKEEATKEESSANSYHEDIEYLRRLYGDLYIAYNQLKGAHLHEYNIQQKVEGYNHRLLQDFTIAHERERNLTDAYQLLMDANISFHQTNQALIAELHIYKAKNKQPWSSELITISFGYISLSPNTGVSP